MRPPEIALANGRQFWAAAHDTQPRVLLGYWYTVAPRSRDMAQQFDVRSLPDFDEAAEPAMVFFDEAGRRSTAAFVAGERVRRAYHAEVIRKCLASGLEPVAVQREAAIREAKAREAMPKREPGDSSEIPF